MIRIGKLGIIRVSGKDMTALRTTCFERDKGLCRECGVQVSDDVPEWHPRKYDMAHVRNKRMYGDHIDNVKTCCHSCHMKEHAGRLPREKTDDAL